jgi:chromatin remodeling complex protein RSC6
MVTKAPKKTETVSKRQPNPAFVRPLVPDEILAAIVGPEPLPRTQVVKKLWEYIKANKLQNKKIIIADAKLKALFDGKDEVDMFAMNKHVSVHLKSDKPAKEEKKKAKVEKEEEAEEKPAAKKAPAKKNK